MSKGFASSFRIFLLASTLLGCFGAFGLRLAWLHVVNREELLHDIVQMRRQMVIEKSRRGDIRDARGAVLATSHAMRVLGVDPFVLRPEDEPKWARLAALIGRPEAEIRRIFTTKYRAGEPERPAAGIGPGASAANPVGISFNPAGRKAVPDAIDSEAEESAEMAPDADGRRPIRWVKLDDDVSETLYAEIEKLGIYGVYGQLVYRRSYPNNQLAAHLLGYVNREQQAVAGMELHADFYLRGQDGWRLGERDGRNRELAQFRSREVPKADGYTVFLTINSSVQDIVERELAGIAARFKPLKATIIVSDTRTGFILGLGNYPTFNPNEYNLVPRDEMARMRNVAVADVYEPGSVFKIVAAAGALEEGLVAADTTFDCSGDRVTYRGRVLKLPGDDHAFNHPLTVAEIIARSSNRGAAHLGMLLGEQRLHHYGQAFGFGRRLGFPVGGEVPGTLAAPEDWDSLTITRMPMGHAIDCTVLQMHQAMSTIANGGLLMRPQIVRQVSDATGDVVFYREEGIELGRAVSPETARTVALMLMGVASRQGTAPEAAIRRDGVDYHVAGKTGTTQKLVRETRADGTTRLVYTNKHHVASFVGFFPATAGPDDRQVAISVIVDDASHAPGGTAYGRTVAAPSFKSIGEKLIPILDIKPPETGGPNRSSLVAANRGGSR
jgi:cell division protein FtsI (penicillin-binding protein 3)